MSNLRTNREIQEEGDRRLTEFKQALLHESSEHIYEQFVLSAVPCVLRPDAKEKLFDQFRAHWGVRVSSLVMVGSAVTGFTIKPEERYRLFNPSDSDIDIAIADSEFFVDIWSEVHRFYEDNLDWHRRDKFEQYLIRGWLRPDYFPGSISDEWFDFFKKVQKTGVTDTVRVRAALYPSLYFLQAYQTRGIDACKESYS